MLTGNPQPATEAEPCQEDFTRHPGGCHQSGQSRRKGSRTSAFLMLPTLPGRGRGGGCRRLVLRPRHHARGSGRGPSLGRTSRRYPRNHWWMRCLVNKSGGRNRAHLVQGRVKQRRRGKGKRRGKVSTTKRATPLAGTVDHTTSRSDTLATQEPQGSRSREHHPPEGATHFIGEKHPETPTSGQSPVQSGGDLANIREYGLQRGDLGARQGNGAFPRLTHLLEGERGQTGRDCIRARKRGGGSPIGLSTSATGNRKETL